MGRVKIAVNADLTVEHSTGAKSSSTTARGRKSFPAPVHLHVCSGNIREATPA